MPFNRPTLRELITRFREDIRTYTDGGDALLRRSVESAFARAVPGLTHGLWGGLAWIARQLFPATADEDNVLRWAAVYGLSLRPAAHATGQAQFASDSSLIPIGALVRRADGVRYEVTAASFDAGICTVQLRAEEPGARGNAAAGTTLQLVSPVAGVSSTGTSGVLSGGADVETVESLRERLVHRMRSPPRGGTAADYVAWALEVPGVTRVWVTPRVMGAGTVGVQFVMDDPIDPFASPIPSDAMVSTVQAHLAERAPVTIGRSIDGEWVGVVVTKPTPMPLTIEIADLVVEDDYELTSVWRAIEREIVDLLRSEVRPGRADGSVVLYRSRLDEAISRAPGERSHRLVQPAADIVVPAGALPIYDRSGGPITWS